MKNGTAEKPNGVISVPPIVRAPRGSISPHWLLLRIPKTARPSPSAESPTPTRSSWGRGSTGGKRFRRRLRSRITATMTVSPAKT
jgi:hypothetical protein